METLEGVHENGRVIDNSYEEMWKDPEILPEVIFSILVDQIFEENYSFFR